MASKPGRSVPSRRRAMAIAIIVATGGCGGPPASTGPGTTDPPSPTAGASTSPSPSDPGAARRADLDHLVERLVAIHPNPFLDEGEAAFRSRLAAIADRAATRTEAGFLVDVMGLMGHRDRDGHSGAWAMAQTDGPLHAWPVWLREFPDGLRVIAARAPYENLIGGLVTAVGGTPIDDARAAVRPLVPADNDSNRRANLPLYLTLPEVLEELGLQRPGRPGLNLEMADGTAVESTPEALPMAPFRDWVFGVYSGRYPADLPPDQDGPLGRQHREEAFWTQVLPDGTLYVGYHEVRRVTTAGRTIEDLAREVADAPARIVVDLRANGGGDNTTYAPLWDALETKAAAGPGRVALLTSRDTFSAAGNFVTQLETGDTGDSILLVGEPPGGGLDIYGDVDVVTLPASGVIVLISGRYHEMAPGDDRLELPPDVPVEATWADVVAGRDPVLDAALAGLAGAVAP